MTKQVVNVYDFDHTIYKGDASLDFIIYCMVRRPTLWKYLPGQAMALVRYIFGSWSRKQVKERAFLFLRDIPDVEATVWAFWQTRRARIEPWYLEQQSETDVVISASPEFLLKSIAAEIGISRLIATEMDMRTGVIDGENCRGEEKVKRLKHYDPTIVIDGFYGDSLSDMPLFTLAKRPFVVKREKLVPLAEYTPSKLAMFKKPAFLRFLFVGGVNSFLGIALSYVISLLVHNPLLAFAMGYSISLVISYFLNAVVTFKELSFSLKQFVKFCVSYIPNFIGLFVAVHVFANILGLYSLVSYILAAIIVAPITFLLLSKFTFTRKASR